MTSPGDQEMGDSALDNSKSAFLSQIPKFGILIPNRIFVGSIAGSTTEADLKHFFSTYGAIKDCKIIVDKTGVSKGYGFVTFENPEDASKLLREEGEHLFFKDRKLNIGPAVRKQQTSTPVLDAGTGGSALVYANGASLAFPNVMPLISGLESFGFPHMAATSYPLMFGAHQQFVMPPNYYSPSSSMATSAIQWGATVGSSPQLHWTAQQSGGGLPLGTNGHFAGLASAALPLPSTSPGHYLYQYPPLTAAFLPPQEMVYPHATGPHYPEVDSSDSSTSAEATSSSQSNNGVLMDSGGISGPVQYIEVSPYAAAASSLVHGMASASYLEPETIAHSKASSNSVEKSSTTQNYGIKRVLAVPRQVVCAPSNPYGFYSVPPVKIIAGHGGQRIVAKSVGTTEIQILPKTQS